MNHIETRNTIEVRELVRRFGAFTAVDHLNFNVANGEIFGFLGANGAGKTTAIRILCGLLSPTSGKALVAGYDVASQPEQVKRSIGYMSQRFSLYEDLTVWENIRLYAGIYGLRKGEIKDRGAQMLERLRITSVRDHRISSLPLGWKQKLAFSIAILHHPAVVFLDEPTAGVDPVSRRQFWDLIYEAAREQITVFVTTHYMDEAEYCDRACILVDGQIKAMDRPEALKEQYNSDSMDGVFVKLARPQMQSPAL